MLSVIYGTDRPFNSAKINAGLQIGYSHSGETRGPSLEKQSILKQGVFGYFWVPYLQIVSKLGIV